MEGYFSISRVGALKERQYTDRNGNQQTFAAKDFVVTNGIDTIYAEAVGDYARSLGTFDTTVMHRIQLQATIREFQDKDGNIRYSNEIRIVKIV